MTEEWRIIPDEKICGKYEVSNLGRIRNSQTKKVLKLSIHSRGYLIFGYIGADKSRHNYYVHRAVALAFIENPLNYETVDHLNGIKTDNSLKNLEWVTKSENSKRAWVSGINNSQLKSIAQVELVSGAILNTYESVAEAARVIKGDASAIVAVARGRQKTSFGYKWQYI